MIVTVLAVESLRALERPTVVTEPEAAPVGLRPHVRPWLLVPVIVAEKLCVWSISSDTVVGESDTATGIRVMVTVAVLVVSTVLVAVSVTVCCDAMELEPYSTPLENVPALGVLQVTARFEVPFTVTVILCVWLAESVTVCRADHNTHRTRTTVAQQNVDMLSV